VDVSAAEACVAWRRRTDLVSRAQARGWVLKDPVTQRYFQLGPEEYFVWSRLDGRRTVTGLCREFATQFSPRLLSGDELQRFLTQLMNQGLVWGDQLGTSAITAKRRASAERWANFSIWTSVLAIRCRGINPDRWLSALLPWCGWLFSPGMLLGEALLICSAIGLWLTQFQEVLHRLPEEAALWSVNDLGSIALALGGLKVLHELGHALVCKKYGGEVRELGVLFLVFTPCLYCNVSDAWLLHSRWQRMAISAAGIWVESTLAAGAFWCWWFSEPGWFHAMCLQMVLISLVSTLAFNLNPLLRYDGYFLLSDAWGQPNLQQTASQQLFRGLERLIWRSDSATALPLQPLLIVYALAAMVYRTCMVFAILWFLYHWLEPQGLRAVAISLMAVTLLTILVMPGLRLKALWQRILHGDQPWRWPSWRVIPLSLLLGATLFWPWPHHVQTTALLLPAQAESLFVTHEGRLQELLPSGSVVQPGDVVARLQNDALDRELERLRGMIATTQQEVEGLLRRRVVDARATLQLPAAQLQLQDWQHQLSEREDDAARLIIRASSAGVYWPAPERPASQLRGQLPNWSGSLSYPQNQDAFLTTGTHLGWIGPADHWDAIAYVPQSNISQLRPGQPVRLLLELAPQSASTGTVTDVSLARSTVVPPEFQQRLQLPTVQDAQGTRLIGAWYQVRIRLSDRVDSPLALARSVASIEAPAASLVQRTMRWFRETFAFLR